MLEQDFSIILARYAPLARVAKHHKLIPPNAKLPYIRYKRVDSTALQTLTGTSNTGSARFQVDVYADSSGVADAVAKHVEKALLGQQEGGIRFIRVDSQRVGFESRPVRHIVMIDFKVNYVHN